MGKQVIYEAALRAVTKFWIAPEIMKWFHGGLTKYIERSAGTDGIIEQGDVIEFVYDRLFVWENLTALAGNCTYSIDR